MEYNLKEAERVIHQSQSDVYLFKDFVVKIYREKEYQQKFLTPERKGIMNGDAYILKNYPSEYFVKMIKEIPRGLVMERVGSRVGGYVTIKKSINLIGLLDWLKGLKRELRQLEITHNDIIPNHICEHNGTFKLIDFGGAIEKKHKKRVEKFDKFISYKRNDEAMINLMIKTIEDYVR